MPEFSVYGCWPETRERFAEVYEAASPRAAEREAQLSAQLSAQDKGGTLWVCRIVAGAVPTADLYTAFVDPQDERNLDTAGLMPDEVSLGGNPDWTVFGLAFPQGADPLHDANLGERYGDVIAAASAGAAEDVARSRLADKEGELWVCAVLAGQVPAVDTYATFTNPDIRNR